MNRIDAKFRELRKARRKALIVYVTAGDPSLAATERAVLLLEKAGADIIELGIPFSDPIADGPTIQAASHRALDRGMTLRKAFELVRRLRRKTRIPIAFMTYFNPADRYGIAEFFDSCGMVGVDGVIIPDLPCEESRQIVSLGRKNGISTIFLVAPTSTRSRIRKIVACSSGFVYYVSLTGVTGARTKLPQDALDNVKRIKAMTNKPVALGFGVSTPEQARSIAGRADGVIVGSAVVKMIGERRASGVKLSRFVASMARAVHNA